MTIIDIAEVPPVVAAGKFTDEMALDWLSANPNATKTVREIAGIWGWHRSRVSRFLSRFRETNGETTALSRETSGETSGDDFDFAQSEVILPPRTSVYAYIERNTGDLRISARDALLQCDTEIRIAAEDVEIFVHRLMALYEDWQKQR
jgi:hypothetical protein